MFVRPSPENDFFPSTLEHRPLHVPEKVELKKYFERTGADEHEGYLISDFAIDPALGDLEAWIWGMRFWGRECIVRAGMAATRMLMEAWEIGLKTIADDPVPLAAAHGTVLTPAEAVSAAQYWANIPSEEKAERIMELVKPMPAEWLESNMLATLEGRPFFWGALAAEQLILGILIKRDEAAVGLARAVCGAARMRMNQGLAPATAAEEIKRQIIADLRAWMGYKW